MINRRILILILLAVFLKQIAWAAFIPLWQTPDEQAHFSQVQNFAELASKTPFPINLSREIWVSEVLLGTNRDGQGNNKFTYHPEFNVAYSSTTTGPFEKKISELPPGYRTDYVKNEGTWYPPLYYDLSAVFHNAVSGGSLFDRVFFVRFVGLAALVAMTWAAYKIGQLIFESNTESLSLAVLVGFMPMLSFVHSGVTSDSLFNLLFTLFIWRCLILIKDGLNVKQLTLVVLIMALSFWTKPQANIMAFILIPLLTLMFVYKKKNWKEIFLILSVMGISLFGIIYRLRSGASIFPETEGLKSLSFTLPEIVGHLQFTLNHTYREVLPWFWGVFRWLSLGLPEPLRKTTNILTMVSAIGFIYFCLKQVLKGNLSRRFWMTCFLTFCLVTYFAAITAFDFGFRQSHGYSFGIQGRYFFPVIVPFFAVFLIGLKSLIPKKYSSNFSALLAILMVIFNILIFFWVTGSYYQFSFPQFFIHASQYKPVWLKYPINLALLSAYLISCVWLCLRLSRPYEDPQNNNGDSQNFRNGKRLFKEN